jgi:hypothetical protein
MLQSKTRRKTVSFAIVLSGLRYIRAVATIAFLTVSFLASSAGNSLAWDVIIAWDPNHETDLAGYAVYYAQNSPGPPYDFVGDLPISAIADPDHPSTSITNLEKNTNYYFALTAYDTDGNESSFSQQLCVRGGVTFEECAAPAPISSFSSSSSSGSGTFAACFIESCRDSAGRLELSTLRMMVFGLPFILAIVIPVKYSKRR